MELLLPHPALPYTGVGLKQDGLAGQGTKGSESRHPGLRGVPEHLGFIVDTGKRDFSKV